MDDVAKQGRTILFVSHNMVAVQGLCSRAIFWRRAGSVATVPVRNGASLPEHGDDHAHVPDLGNKTTAPGNDRLRLRRVQVVPTADIAGRGADRLRHVSADV